MLKSPLREYGFAVVVSAASVLLTLTLHTYLARGIFIFFLSGVALVALRVGRRGGLLATALNALAVLHLFIPPTSSLRPANVQDAVAVILFTVMGVVISSAAGEMRRARREAEARSQQLEEQAMELELQATELAQQSEEARELAVKLEETNRQLTSSMEEQLEEAQHLAHLGSWEWDIARDEITWSDELYRIYGFEPNQIHITFDVFRSLLHPDDRPRVESLIQRALHAGESFTFEHRIIRADGSERMLEARGKPVRDADGKLVKLVGTGQDITDLRAAEQALLNAAESAAKRETAEAASRHLHTIFNEAPVVIAVVSGPDHVIETANPRFTELVGKRDIIGKPTREALADLEEPRFFDLLDQVYSSGRPFIGNEMYARLKGRKALLRDGSDPGTEGRHFNFVFQPLRDDRGVYGIVVVASDVTDLVRARVAAEKAEEAAVSASKAKSDFLAKMSHELRTPLGAIIGYTELLTEGITGPVNDDQLRQLRRIKVSANHLLGIIDDILTLSRVEAGKERLATEQIEVTELLESVAAMGEPLAAAKQLNFRVNYPREPIRIPTDPTKLRQVLLNLVSNAVKYTEKGEVEVSASAVDGQVTFGVRDTGIGLSREHLDRIFEPFWQVEQTTTRRSGGTGLGLAVARQYVELLGGYISVESKPNEGSAFKVTIPA